MNLNRFKEINLFNAGTSFFKQLNIRLNSSSTSSLPLKSILKDKFKSQEIFEKVSETYFLGLVDSSVFDDNLSLFDDGNVTFDQAVEKIHADYEGMMIFAVQIKKIASPTRTQLSDLTRAFNRASQSLPVVVLFQYNDFLTLATSERITYKQPWREGEKIGKISLLKDIDILNPHTGHIKILNDLVLKLGVRDFSGLYQQWREVFDVQLLNRNFYKELSSWYFWALRQVEFPDDAEKNKEIRNSTSVIRLITRLIFVWFLKEKRLVPEILFNNKVLDEYLKHDDINNSAYYKAILQNLFFATLNTKMKKDDKESRKFVNRQYGVQAFYRYERYFKDKKKALKLFEAIPFLNGGLFENLDKNIGKDNEIRIDCFSNRPIHEKKLKVPDCLFFGDEVVIDLSKEFGSNKRKKEKVRGIIHILNSYKFTIDENTPIEEEIALDPELLGKVFENLLASYNPETQTTARKQTGSFYTPREIVDYMVDESLKASLSNLVSKKIDNATEDDIKTGLDILFEYTEKEHAFTDDEVSKIVEAISELKILDPACGSGAFPMGILHKLVFILNKIDGDNKKWRDLQKQRAVKETEKAYSVGDKEERHQRLKEIEEAFDFNTSDYGRKLFLIENSIYGVDIQPIAVQIAKLRFFISLIVDQKTDEDKENLGILPLPNLETKFVAANTLIGIEKKGQIKLNFQNFEIKEKEKELAKVRERHFLARTPQTKEKRRVEDESLRNEIAVLLEKDGFASDVTKKLANWNPYDQNASADFFDMEWMFGVKDGFDVVIANPPYVQIKQIPWDDRKIYKKKFKSAVGRFNLFYFFLEFVSEIVKEGGFSTFIVPDRLLLNTQCDKLRKWLLQEQQIIEIDSFDEAVFEAVVDNIVIIYKNSQDSYEKIRVKSKVLLDNLDRIDPKQIPVSYFADSYNSQFDLDYDSKTNVIISKIENKSVQLCTISETKDGIIQGKVADKLFLRKPIDQDSKKLLFGENVVRYNITFKNNWVNYKLKEMMKLEVTRREPGVRHGLWMRNPNIFERNKILTRQTADEIIAAYDTDNFYYSNTLHGTAITDSNFSPYYVLAILNSKLTNWYYRTTTAEDGKVFAQIKIAILKKLPILNISIEQQESFATVVDKMVTIINSEDCLENPNKQTQVGKYEKQIDQLVYKLYNFTPEEIKIVEGKH